jgi:serine protease inhibitor
MKHPTCARLGRLLLGAAATAVFMRDGALPPRSGPKRLVVDRPFVFLLRDATTGTVLFLGRVADPSASGSGGSPTPASKL